LWGLFWVDALRWDAPCAADLLRASDDPRAIAAILLNRLWVLPQPFGGFGGCEPFGVHGVFGSVAALVTLRINCEGVMNSALACFAIRLFSFESARKRSVQSSFSFCVRDML
jgi:hypothetical protein